MNHLMALGGLLIGLCFGAVCQVTRFCLNGALLEAVGEGDPRRLQAFLLAMGTAVIGTQLLEVGTPIELRNSAYQGATLLLGGSLLGGFVFGVGMIVANGCPTRHLIRLSSGDSRSLIALLTTAIVGYMTMRGLLSFGRNEWNNLTQVDLQISSVPSQSVLEWLAYWMGTGTDIWRYSLLVVVAVGVLTFCFRHAEFRGASQHVFGGLSVGGLIVGAWAWTGILGNDDFEPAPLESISFIAPVGNTLQYLMTYTGSTIDFGIALVLGTIVGSLALALLTQQFKRQTFTVPGEFGSRLIGGIFMGFGGVVAGGCTVGQMLTGFSTLSWGSLLASIAIFAGARLAVQVRLGRCVLLQNLLLRATS
jgi:uncharacterized membrane protein YedE/YeeE